MDIVVFGYSNEFIYIILIHPEFAFGAPSDHVIGGAGSKFGVYTHRYFLSSELLLMSHQGLEGPNVECYSHAECVV